MQTDYRNKAVSDQLFGDAWFDGLPDSLQDSLLEAGVVRTHAKGTRLLARGDLNNGIYAVLKGRLCAFGVNEIGEEAMLMYLDPITWFGEIGLFDRLPCCQTIRAGTQATVFWLSDIKLRALLQTNPEHWYHFALLLTRKLRLALFLIDGRGMKPTDIKVARLLLLLSSTAKENLPNSRMGIHIPQLHVAQMLGLSRQTTNQAMQRLRQLDIITMNRENVDIIDLKKIRDLVCYTNWLPVTARRVAPQAPSTIFTYSTIHDIA